MKVGDKVRVVKYGHILIMGEYEQSLGFPYKYDINPSIIGKEGVIVEIKTSKDLPTQYELSGIPEKVAWYNEDQLVLLEEKH